MGRSWGHSSEGQDGQWPGLVVWLSDFYWTPILGLPSPSLVCRPEPLLSAPQGSELAHLVPFSVSWPEYSCLPAHGFIVCTNSRNLSTFPMQTVKVLLPPIWVTPACSPSPGFHFQVSLSQVVLIPPKTKLPSCLQSMTSSENNPS